MADNEQIELPDATTTVQAVERPTRETVIGQGWSKEEADKGEKFGLVKKDDPKPEETAEKKPEAAKPPVQERRAEDRRKGGEVPDIELTPEQEQKLHELGISSLSGAFNAMKRERALKQRWREDAERYKAEAEALRKAQPKQDAPADGDDEDRPLTLKEWKALQQKEAEERQRQMEEQRSQGTILSSAFQTHEEIARATYEDFNDVVTLSKDLMQNLDKYYPSGKQRAKVINAWGAFVAKAGKAHELDPENDLTEADLAYELGKLHPKYGKKDSDGDADEAEADDNGTQPEISPRKANGGHTPEKLQRIENNTQRRVSSAAIPGGGGKRSVSAAEVTLADLNRMSSQQRESFKSKHPERYSALLRG